MITEKGDSGSPLIVQPYGVSCFYLIGLHRSKKPSNTKKVEEINSAVRITNKMVNQLA